MDTFPTHLTICPCCGQSQWLWEHEGKQEFPEKYAKLGTFKENLDSGSFVWSPDGKSFGYEMYSCPNCLTTISDTWENNYVNGD